MSHNGYPQGLKQGRERSDRSNRSEESQTRRGRKRNRAQGAQASGGEPRRRKKEKEVATNIHWNIIRFKDAPSAVRLITHEWMITKQQAIS